MKRGIIGVVDDTVSLMVPDRSLGLRRTADYEQLAAAVAKSGFELPPARSSKGADAIARVAVDCINTAQGLNGIDRYGDTRSGWTSVSFSEEWWRRAQGEYPHSVGYGTVVPAVRAMAEHGLIEELQIGIPRGRTSALKAAEGKKHLQTRFLSSIGLQAVKLPATRHDVGSLIRLRGSDGSPDRVPVNRVVDRMLRFTSSINEAIQAADIVLKAPGMRDNGDGTISFGSKGHTVWTDRLQLYRVFNEGFDKGGRYYGGWWQGVSSKDRAWFLLNGEETIEIDYETLHPRLLRALLGAPEGTGDEYLIPGFEDQRKLCKIAYNALLNAGTRESALGAIAARAQKIDDVRMGNVRPLPTDGSKAQIEKRHMRLASDLIDAIKRRHPETSHGFHTSLGLTLQNADSEVATEVLRELTVKRGIVALPIHDSFIVAKRDASTLQEAMDKALNTKLEKLRDGAASRTIAWAYGGFPLHEGGGVRWETGTGTGTEVDAGAAALADADGIRETLEIMAPFFVDSDIPPSVSQIERDSREQAKGPSEPSSEDTLFDDTARRSSPMGDRDNGSDGTTAVGTVEKAPNDPSEGHPWVNTGSEPSSGPTHKGTNVEALREGTSIRGDELSREARHRRPAFLLRSPEEAREAEMRELIRRRLEAPMGPRPKKG